MSTKRVSDKSRHAFVRGGDRPVQLSRQSARKARFARLGTDICQATRKSLSLTEASSFDMKGIIAGRSATILHTVSTIK